MGKSKRELCKLEKQLQHAIKEEQIKLEILDSLSTGIIIFNADLSINHINTQAKTLLNINHNFDPYQDPLRLYKNRKANLRFNLPNWLDCMRDKNCSTHLETKVWYNHPKTLLSNQLLLNARPLNDAQGQLNYLLLAIYDQSMNDKALAQKRLFQAAFNGVNAQFITNEKGFIIEANEAFQKLSGLDKKQLKKTTLLNWIERFVEWDNSAESFINSVLHKKFWNGEVQIYHQDQSMIHAAMTISMIVDSEQNLEFFVVNIQNTNDIKEAHQQIEHMALYDGLTELPNRKLILQHINKLLVKYRAEQTYGSILNVNLNRFRSINDAYGRLTGDRFLKRIATTISSVLGSSEQLAKVGGDEFIIVMQNNEKSVEKTIQQSLKLANKILTAINQHFLIESLTLNASARIGLLNFPENEADTGETLLIKSDLAVSEAKNVNDKFKTYVYQSTLTAEAKLKRELENDLAHAAKRNELKLYYQAKIDAQQNIIGAETLLRWFHPSQGNILPSQFIPIAEESRQIIAIGNWVMQQAFSQAREWSQQQPRFNVAVNISPIQFHEADFIEHVLINLTKTGVNPNNITLELTENVFISDTQSAFQKIAGLAELGFKVSIDDFGTGYSSLSYFQKLPINELKIDKSFIDKVPSSLEDVAIIESIIHLAKSKHLAIVAEGVENQQQAEFLHTLNPETLIQGYLYSRPCPATEFESQFFANK